MLQSNRELAIETAGILFNKKGLDVIVIDIAEKSSFADFFVIASGNSERQVTSLADEVDLRLAKKGIMPGHIEGTADSGWILMDYGDIIVNIFTKEQRSAYHIEQIWGDGEIIEIDE
ncbi:MAG: ribosome silencing factor [Clostridiales Family XIII bacterium]|jgi:ribosome-associated protein|nr:ribosome silencing factor [Clostridiales Family XIII bacterium]